VCTLSKSPPPSFGCDPILTDPPSSTFNETASASAAYSNTPLIVSLDLYSSDLRRYGLLVESLPLDGHDDDCGDRRGEATTTLLDLPPGSLVGTAGAQEYSLPVRLGRWHRIVLLNTAGAETSGGRFVVRWGDEPLVSEGAIQGGLQVYSIERRFRIDDVDRDSRIVRVHAHRVSLIIVTKVHSEDMPLYCQMYHTFFVSFRNLLIIPPFCNIFHPVFVICYSLVSPCYCNLLIIPPYCNMFHPVFVIMLQSRTKSTVVLLNL